MALTARVCPPAGSRNAWEGPTRGRAAAGVVFLGNIQPGLQSAVRAECSAASLVGLDSMNLWIDTQRDALLEAIRSVDAVLLNDAEVRALTREPNTVRAARKLRSLGPR